MLPIKYANNLVLSVRHNSKGLPRNIQKCETDKLFHTRNTMGNSNSSLSHFLDYFDLKIKKQKSINLLWTLRTKFPRFVENTISNPYDLTA